MLAFLTASPEESEHPGTEINYCFLLKHYNKLFEIFFIPPFPNWQNLLYTLTVLRHIVHYTQSGGWICLSLI